MFRKPSYPTNPTPSKKTCGISENKKQQGNDRF